jgi:hypothetical protein
VRRGEQRLDHPDDLGQRPRAPGQHAVHEPLPGPRPTAHIGDQRDAARHRHLVDQQIHRQSREVWTVTRRCARHLRRQHPDMLGPAGAADPVHLVLADRDPNLGQIMHLVGARDAHIVRVNQIPPAPAPASPTVRHPLIRGAHPPHRVALGALLLSRLTPRVRHPLRCRLRPSRKIITGRRHGGVATVPGGPPLQLAHPLLQRHIGLTQPLHHSDQLLARQLLQPRHNARSSHLTAN